MFKSIGLPKDLPLSFYGGRFLCIPNAYDFVSIICSLLVSVTLNFFMSYNIWRMNVQRRWVPERAESYVEVFSQFLWTVLAGTLKFKVFRFFSWTVLAVTLKLKVIKLLSWTVLAVILKFRVFWLFFFFPGLDGRYHSNSRWLFMYIKSMFPLTLQNHETPRIA